ncbi:hypothetical protein BGZ95_000915, partial [Linnemannia exigua]
MINSLATDMLPMGMTIKYLAEDAVLDDWSNGMTNYPPKVLNSMNPSGIPPVDFYSKGACQLLSFEIWILKEVYATAQNLSSRSLDP